MYAKKSFLLLVIAAGIILLFASGQVRGITVISRAPNVEIVLDLPIREMEFENPLTGTEMTYGYRILEWRDADYASPAWYDDWTVSHPGAVDGNPDEIWMRANGHAIWTTTTVPSRIVTIHLTGDDNDGLASVLVDGNEVARLDMGNSQPPDRVLIIVKSLPSTIHTVTVKDLGVGPGGFGTDVHCFGAAAVTRVFGVKWNQPPQPASPSNLFYGWNEKSIYEHDSMPPHNWIGVAAADDWVCTSERPITTIRWWGSHIGWQETTPPPAIYLPDRFVFTIWTDVPAGIEPFSHPGTVLWRYEVSGQPTTEFVGFDYDPRQNWYESCFRYSIDLPPERYFCQTGVNNIYWLSIAAVYDSIPPASPLYKWGWKTRPRNPSSTAPDDAVRIFDPLLPHVGQSYVAGEPIWWPAPEESWDLAFELLSNVKWGRPPELTFAGIDVNASHSTMIPSQQHILADDFLCTQTGPIGTVSIWGSWYNDILPVGGAGNVTFTLSIHRDIPANPPSIPYSRPGALIWSGNFVPGSFQVTPLTGAEPEGWMNLPDPYLPDNHQGVYRYDFTLPPTVVQSGTPSQPVIYWLNVHAAPATATALFGWKTSICHWNDDAVWGNGTEPFNGPWNELRYPFGHPYYGQSMDMAFVIGGQVATPELKWSQPPQPYAPPDGFEGWNELSRYGGQQITADDWVCTDGRPVTDIHWWGSFIGWNWPSLPYSSLPSRFHLAIWTDEPAGATPYSHPGQLIWETWCDNYSVEFVGWDFDPRDPDTAPEACFKFECDLPQNMWFYQDPASGSTIYWLSIAPQYDLAEPPFPWGWKTTPRLDAQSPDDGIVILDPLAPTVGSEFVSGLPLEFPPGISWDLAFVLTSEGIGPEPKWSQMPHGPGQGFDAASDVWWAPGITPGSKWEQLVDASQPALHAHDWDSNRLILANDWLCMGGAVTDLHWWGTGEPTGGAAQWGFLISIHASTPDPPCLPADPPLWAAQVPMSQITVTATGMVNSDNEPIFLYEYVLPEPFIQVPGERYWMNICSISVDPQHPFLWKWQLSQPAPAMACPAAEKQEPAGLGWQPIGPAARELAMRVTSTDPPERINKVVADDFVSDGRRIRSVRWWGSYLDDRYAPGAGVDPEHVLDGWLISFHWADDGGMIRTCPPDSLFDPPPTVLGVYFAPPNAVMIEPLGDWPDCFGHPIHRYTVDLAQCCLICSEADPRTGSMPAQTDSFAEEPRLRYWLDIQAVTGAQWLPSGPGECLLFLTGHVPPENGEHFWGWHTSPGPTDLNLCGALGTACTGRITDISMYPPNCWQYGQWTGQPWLCPVMPPDPIPPVHMAFELITVDAPVLLAPWIVDEPESAVVCEGDSVSFTVEACGTPPLAYQWKFNGGDILGANGKTYTIPMVAESDEGQYTCQVSNMAGAALSAAAQLTVWPTGTGDVSADTRVDGLDIQPFIEVMLTSTTPAVPGQRMCAADMDGDGDVDMDDVPLFVAALLSVP